MDFDELVRTRRTHKAYDPAPVDRETLDELFELARWAPNHHLTNPWRFRVIGPRALEALKVAAGPEHAAKLDRAPCSDGEHEAAAWIAAELERRGARARVIRNMK